jgi:tellurite resistance protein
MAKLFDWIKAAAVKAIDPRREQRIAALAEQAWRGIIDQRGQFNLAQMVQSVGAEPEDVPLVAERVYDSALRKGWKDGVLSDSERKSLDVIVRVLGLTPTAAQQIEWRVGLEVFEKSLGAAFEDGQIDEREAARLRQIATSLGTDVRQLMGYYFLGKGQGFLRGMFTEMMQGGGVFSGREWQKLVTSSKALGLTEAQLRDAIEPQARQYVEHVLVDQQGRTSGDRLASVDVRPRSGVPRVREGRDRHGRRLRKTQGRGAPGAPAPRR